MKTKVIVIDDHSLFNDGLSLILKESKKFEVVEQIYDSRHAYFKCFALMPNLVIVDFNMPYINGLEVVRQLKTIRADMKIVIVSMYADKKEISLFKEVGVDGYITKTTPAKALLENLNEVLAGKKIFEPENSKKEQAAKDDFAKTHQLTKRELEILRHLKVGKTTEQVATELGLSYYTVETHRKNVNQKMKFSTKKEFFEFLEKI
jgi:DNA-binding NarL/FixJ family response regulator